MSLCAHIPSIFDVFKVNLEIYMKVYVALLNTNLLYPEHNVVFQSLIFVLGQVKTRVNFVAPIQTEVKQFHPSWIVKKRFKLREI